MRKLHDLKIMLSADTQLSRVDCMKIKGGTDDKRRGRGDGAEAPGAVDGSTGEIGGVGGSYGG